MPAAITADWEAVKTTAIALNSIKDASEQHQVSYKAAKMRASRESWPVGQRLAKNVVQVKQELANGIQKANPNQVTTVTSSANALVNHFLQTKQKSRTNLAKYVLNGSKIAARSRSPLSDAGKVKDLASVMEKVWPEEKVKNDSGLVAIQLIRMELPKEEKIVLDYSESQAALPAR